MLTYTLTYLEENKLEEEEEDCETVRILKEKKKNVSFNFDDRKDEQSHKSLE